MKIFLRLLVLLVGVAGVRTSSFAQSGWFWQNPLPTGNTLLAGVTLVHVHANVFPGCGDE